MYETNLIDLKASWYIISFAYRWLGDKRTKTVALPDFPSYKKDPEDDKALCRRLWELFDEADVIVAHNGRKFDCKKAKARFIKHRFPPESPFKIWDTLVWARQVAAFTSNKLNDLGAHLGIGRKLPHTGWDLWKRCIVQKEKKAWATMRRYNARDVDLLLEVFLRLRPHVKSLTSYSSGPECPSCYSHHTQRRGEHITASGHRTRRFRYQCREFDCGHWFIK